LSKNNIKIGIFFVVILVAISIRYSELSDRLENTLLDFQFQYLRNNHPFLIEQDVVVVGIDEQTFKTYREPIALWHPHLSKFFESMAISQPAVLGIDLVLPDRSYDFLVEGNDRKLLASLLKLKATTKIVVAQTIDEKSQLRPLFAPLISILGREALGLVLVGSDNDGTIRRYETHIQFGRDKLPTFATLITEKQGTMAEGGLINYLPGSAFSYIPLQRVVSWLDDGKVEQLEDVFGGKTVLLGSVLPFVDRHRLPVVLYAPEANSYTPPGVLIHAQIIRTVLNQAELNYVNKIILVSLLIVALLFYLVGQKLQIGITILGIFIITLLSLSTTLLFHSYFMPVASILFISVIAFSSRVLVEGSFSYLDKKRLSHSFGKYVSPQVMDEIIAGNITPDMEGQRREVCVLFSDIRSFTSRSESQAPELIISLLNKYFNEMTAVIHAHGGTVDKFIGDGLMVFFGAPNTLKNPAINAFDAAKDMLTRLAHLNEQLRQENTEEIQIGIGVHFGEAVVGHVGSDTRHEYTIIGDTVNLAARLEGRTKELGYPIICSETVFEKLESSEELVELGYTPIKGRSDAKVFGWKPAST
jgi:adenylate cyclase